MASSRPHTHCPPPSPAEEGGAKSFSGRYLRSKRSGNREIATLRDRILDSKIVARGRSLLQDKSPLPSWTRPFEDNDANLNYLPHAKITLLLHGAPDVCCQICQDSRFRLDVASEGGYIPDDIFSILPCAHIAGSECMRKWCEENKNCPFCRLDLVYPGCGHDIAPRPITYDSMHVLPDTIPNGGSIPDVCSECLRLKLRQEAGERFFEAQDRFEMAREKAKKAGFQAWNMQELLRTKEDLESAVREGVHVKYFTTLLNSW